MTSSKFKQQSARVSMDAPSSADGAASLSGPAPPIRRSMRSGRHAVSNEASFMPQHETRGSSLSLQTSGKAVEHSRGSGDDQAGVFRISADEMLAEAVQSRRVRPMTDAGGAKDAATGATPPQPCVADDGSASAEKTLSAGAADDGTVQCEYTSSETLAPTDDPPLFGSGSAGSGRVHLRNDEQRSADAFASDDICSAGTITAPGPVAPQRPPCKNGSAAVRLSPGNSMVLAAAGMAIVPQVKAVAGEDGGATGLTLASAAAVKDEAPEAISPATSGTAGNGCAAKPPRANAPKAAEEGAARLWPASGAPPRVGGAVTPSPATARTVAHRRVATLEPATAAPLETAIRQGSCRQQRRQLVMAVGRSGRRARSGEQLRAGLQRSPRLCPRKSCKRWCREAGFSHGRPC